MGLRKIKIKSCKKWRGGKKVAEWEKEETKVCSGNKEALCVGHNLYCVVYCVGLCVGQLVLCSIVCWTTCIVWHCVALCWTTKLKRFFAVNSSE